MEKWKSCVGYEGLYEVSSLGRVRRSGGPGKGVTIGKILSPGAKEFGHLNVSLRKDGKSHTEQVHKLVCEAFHGPKPRSDMMVAHRNCDPGDNSVGNVRWATAKENSEDSVALNRMNRGTDRPLAKLDESAVRAIRADARTKTAIAADYGVSRKLIADVKSRIVWKHVH